MANTSSTYKAQQLKALFATSGRGIYEEIINGLIDEKTEEILQMVDEGSNEKKHTAQQMMMSYRLGLKEAIDTAITHKRLAEAESDFE